MDTIDQDLTELTLRFEFQPSNNEAAKQIALIHTHLLMEIQRAFNDDVVLYNNKNVKLGEIDMIKWSSPTMHQRNFLIHALPGNQRRRSKYTILHRIHTTQTLSTIRHFHSIDALLKKHDCYLRSHAWEETVWDTVQAGYCINLNPQHYNPAAAIAVITKEVLAKNPKAKLPPVRLIYASPRSNHNHRTKAYAIEFARTDAAVALRILKDTYAGTNRLLLAKMRYTNPVAFSNAIKMQNQHLGSAYVLPMTNVSEASLFYIRSHIMSVKGVIDIVSTSRTHIHGRYNILVKKESFKPVKAWLMEHFTAIYQQYVPSDAHSNEFAGEPNIGTRGSDEESDGDQSFLSMSAASFASVDTASFPDTFEVHTASNATYSWSDITSGNNTPATSIPTAVTTTQVSELTSTPSNSDNSELENLKQQFQQLQIHSESQHKTDQIKITELRLAFEKQATALEALTKLILGMTATATPAPSAASAPVPEPPATEDLNMEYVTALQEHSKRGNEEEPLTQEPKRLDAKQSPARENFQ